MDLGIAGRTALVTGASSGIGRAVAAGLAREGVRLAVTARRGDLLRGLAKEITDGGGCPPAVIECDLLRDDAPASIADRAAAALGTVQILVNNAGGSRRFGLDTGDDEWDEALTLNFTRHRQLTTRLLPAMIDGGWGPDHQYHRQVRAEGINGAFAARAEGRHDYVRRHRTDRARRVMSVR